MKTKTPFFLVLLIGFTFSISLINASPSITSTEFWQREALISADNLDFQLQEISGFKQTYQVMFDRLDPLGYEEINENITKYKAKVYFIVTSNIWTEKTLDQAIGFSELTGSAHWLKLLTSVDFNINDVYTDNFYASYNYLKINSNNIAGFDGYLTMNANLKDITPSSLNFGNDQIEITNKEFLSTFDSATVISSSVVSIATYTNAIQEIGSTSLRTMDFNQDKRTPISKAGDAKTPLSDAIENGNLGITRKPQWKSTYQQSGFTPPVIGSDVKTKGINLKMVPGITLLKEPINRRYQVIAVDTLSNIFGISPAGLDSGRTSYVSETLITDRIIAIELNQKAIQFQMRLGFSVYSLMETKRLVTPEKPTLEIPKAQIGDYLWGSTIGGDTGVVITIDTSDPILKWFNGIMNMLFGGFKWVFWLIGIVIVVFVIKKVRDTMRNPLQTKVQEIRYQ